MCMYVLSRRIQGGWPSWVLSSCHTGSTGHGDRCVYVINEVRLRVRTALRGRSLIAWACWCGRVCSCGMGCSMHSCSSQRDTYGFQSGADFKGWTASVALHSPVAISADGYCLLCAACPCMSSECLVLVVRRTNDMIRLERLRLSLRAPRFN